MPQLATFLIGDETFAIDILLTKEIGRMTEITSIPEAPKQIVGLMNLRGQILTIMDPRVFLDRESHVRPEHRRLIILKTESELAGLRRDGEISTGTMARDPLAIVIDEMGDVLEVERDQVSPPPPNLSTVNREFVSGVVQLKNNLVIILAIDRLVQLCMQG